MKEYIKTNFFSKNFLIFVVIGVVNAFNGIFFSYIFSLFIKQANISFILGYLVSLTISYLLNSKFNFKESIKLKKYLRFCFSYIPNFIIQNIVVLIFYNILGWEKLIVYAVAAMLGIPITYLLIKSYAFGKNKKKIDFKSTIKKYKNEIIIFLVGIIFYYVLGIILSYYFDTAKYWSVLFDLDTPRVLGDLSLKDFNHYRASVHPLFILLFQPVIYVIKNLLGNPILAIITLQSFLASITLVFVNKTLDQFKSIKNIKHLILIIFAISFSQTVFSASIETYIYAQFILVPMWYFVIKKIDKKLELKDYVLLVIFGIGSIAITITNFFQFLIALFFLVTLNKKIDKKILISVILLISVLSISITLAEIQQLIWESAPNFFSKGIKDFLLGSSEELLYIDKVFSFKSILNVLNANFSQSLNIAKFILPKDGYVTFFNSTFSNLFSVVFGGIFFVSNIIFIIKTKFEIKKHKIYYALLISWIFNFALHILYGNTISFIYVCHFNFITLYVIVYLIEHLKINLDKVKPLLFIITGILGILSFRNLFILFYEISKKYSAISSFSVIPFVFISILFIVLILFVFKNNYIRFFSILFTLLFCFCFYSIVNNSIKADNNFGEFSNKIASLENYKKQLKNMKNEFFVKTYSDVETPIDVFFFGMAKRPKILYKDGKLINFKTKEVLYSFEFDNSWIIPNEYTVLLKKGENFIEIYENEDGIYISDNGEVEVVFEQKKSINLPEFKNHRFSEILKVVHQELLFNIDGDVPKPNLLTYTGAWYRDTMLVVKVLEETQNTHLLEKWVKSIDSIYDYQRSSSIKETDNLGELLYIIGATKVDKKDLVKKIIDEIYRLKNSDGLICGSVDGSNQCYYPTVLALYGAEKMGITLDLTMPSVDDGYAKLTWYKKNQNIDFNSKMDSRWYPYLGWAFLNYDIYSSKPYILDEIYPLSYEGGIGSGEQKTVESECFISEYYCEERLYISHSWSASEIFMFLLNS